MDKIFRYFLYLCLISSSSQFAVAKDVLVLNETQEEYVLGKYISVLEDPSGKLSINDVTQAKYNDQYQIFKEDSPNLGLSESVYWIRLQIENNSKVNHWVIAQHVANSHYLDLFKWDKNNKSYGVKNSGNLIPYSKRDIPHHLPIFNINIKAQEKSTVYLRYQSQSAISLKLKLWSETSFANFDRKESFLIGLFYGSYFVILLINLFLYFFFRKDSYLYLTLYVVFTGLSYLTYDGYIQILFSGNNIEISKYIIPIFSSLSMVMLLYFCRVLLLSTRNHPNLIIINNSLVIAWLITLIAGTITTYHNILFLIVPLMLITLLYLLSIGMLNWREYKGAGRFVVIGLMLYLLGYLGLAFVRFGFIESNLLFEQGIRFSNVLLLLFMSLAIVDHIQKLHSLKERTSKELSSSEKNYQLLFESAHDAIFIMKDKNFVDCNPKTLEMFGCKRSEIIGQTPMDFSPEFQPNGLMSKDVAADVIQSAYKGDLKFFEWQHCKLDGTLFDAEVSLNKINIDGYDSLQAIVRDVTERKKAEVALRESEEKFRLLSEQSMLGIVIIQDDVFKYVNQATSDMNNYTIDTMMSWQPREWLSKIIHPDDIDVVREQASKKQLGDNDVIQKYSCRSLTKAGKAFWVEVFSRTIQFEGRPADLVTIVDISSRKRSDEAIRNIATGVSGQSGDVFFQDMVKILCKLFDAKYAFIGLLDENDTQQINTKAVCVNGEIANNMSYRLEDTPCADVINDKTCTYPDHVQQLFPKDALLQDMGGESYIGTPLYDTSNTPIGLIVILDTKPMSDLDQVKPTLNIFSARASAELERMKAEKMLLGKEREQREIIQSMVDGIVTIDEDGKMLSFNRSAENLFGYSATEIMGESVSKLMPEPYSSEYDKYIQHNLKKGIKHIIDNDREVDGLRKDDSLFPMRISVTELPDDGSNKKRFIASCHDLTQIKQQEDQLRRSQKMDALGKLTGGIAHDYNNMLGVIMGYTELLGDSLNEQPDLMEFIKEIRHAGDRGIKLSKKLLSFSSKKSSITDVIDINTLLRDEQHMLEKTLTARINLILDLDDEIWPVKLDSSDLEDAILNLCINASHAIENVGTLTINTGNVHISDIDAQYYNVKPGDYVLLSITDTGCGMDDVTSEKLFDPFYSTKGEKGTGLGLSQVYGFIERSNGAVKVYSELNHGSQFNFYFPRSDVESNSKIEQENKTDLNLTGTENILVVDDEINILKLAEQMLSQSGYHVLCTSRGADALDILEKEKIDLLISDVIMPEMDGYELVAKVNEKYPDVKVLLMSGFSDTRHENMVDETLHKNLLAKPFKLQSLLKKIRDLLN